MFNGSFMGISRTNPTSPAPMTLATETLGIYLDGATATFAGPSCDSFDVMFRDKMTPPLAVDDLILVPNCGAYTSASATTFNGFAKAPVVVWEDVKAELS